ncbi:MAG: hypothetical protein WC509_03810 [Candidatus Izemoplasmatales bacterium]
MADRVRRIVRFAAAALVFALSLAVVVYYVLGPAEGYFHSDSTDTIFWAEASYVSGMAVNPDFNYAAILPIGGNLLMGIWMPFFGTSMTTQALGMLSFLVVLAAALLFFFRSMRFGWTGTLFYAGLVLLALSATDKLREMFWGHVIYYSIYVVFLLVGFGLLARLERTGAVRSWKTWVLLGALFAYAALVAIDGLQLVFIVLVPIGGAIAAERYFDYRRPLAAKANLPVWIVLATIAVGALTGLRILAALKHGQVAGYADAWYAITPISTWREHLEKIPEHWITLLGGGVPTDPAATFIVAENFASLGFSLFLAVFPLLSLVVFRKAGTLFKVFAVQHFALSVLIFLACVFGSLGAANWRWIPVVASALILTVLTIRELSAQFSAPRFAVPFALVLLAFAALNAIEIARMDADYGRDNRYHVLAAELAERGLTYGYADFWIAQAVTVVSDGEVRVRSVNVDATNGLTPYYYQSAFSWYEAQEGVDRYFVVMTTAGYNQLRASDMYDEIVPHWVETFSVEGYSILVFNENVF